MNDNDIPPVAQDANEVPPVEMTQELFDSLPPEEQRYISLHMGIQQLSQQVQNWLSRAQQSLRNHNIRLNVIETFLTHPEFADLRKKLVLEAVRGSLEVTETYREGAPIGTDPVQVIKVAETDNLSMEDFYKIGTDVIIPALQKREQEIEAQTQAAMRQAQENAKPSPIMDPSTGKPVDKTGGLVGPDGRRLVVREG